MNTSSLTAKTIVQFNVRIAPLSQVSPGVQMAEGGSPVNPEDFPCLVFETPDGDRFIYPMSETIRGIVAVMLCEAGIGAEQAEQLRQGLTPTLVIAKPGDVPPLPGSNGHGERHLKLT